VRFAAAKVRMFIESPPRQAICLAAVGTCLLLGCAAEPSQDDSAARSAKLAIPIPERALLQRQTEPGCELKTSQPGAGGHDGQGRKPEPSKAAKLAALEQSVRSDGERPALPSSAQSDQKLGQADPNAALGLRIRLEYERDCFRRAEVKVRDRLHRLQDAAGKTIKAVKRAQRDGS
jgi:hypothetical protein